MNASKSNIQHVYYNTLGNCRYTFKSGKDLHFLGGKAHTNIQAEIDELNAEVEAGHPHIYVDADNLTEDMTKVDPMEAIKAKVREELLAEMAITLDKTNDRGTYGAAPASILTNIANSDTISEAASGSTSSDGAPAPATATIVTPTAAPIIPKIIAGPVVK